MRPYARRTERQMSSSGNRVVGAEPTPEQLGRLAERALRAHSSAVETWAESVRLLSTAAPDGADQPPGPVSVVDTAFRFVEQLLRIQRELARHAVQALVSNEASGAPDASPRPRTPGDSRHRSAAGAKASSTS